MEFSIELYTKIFCNRKNVLWKVLTGIVNIKINFLEYEVGEWKRKVPG